MKAFYLSLKTERCDPPQMLKVTGTCTAFEGGEVLLMSKILKVLKKLEKFGGRIFKRHLERTNSGEIIIYYYLIFASQEDANEAFQLIREGAG